MRLPAKTELFLKSCLLALGLAVLGFGCTTATVVDSGVKPVVLREVQTRKSLGINTIHLPKGVYEPDFQTSEGVYYRAPAKIACDSLGINQVLRGGLFVPFESAKDNRQGAWFDQQESSGGLFGFAASSNKRVYRFKVPVEFEYVEESKSSAQTLNQIK